MPSIPEYKQTGIPSLSANVKNIVDHPQLSRFYQEDIEVYNEIDILIPQKFIVRPDRIVKNNDGWVIIDYKTGKERPIILLKLVTMLSYLRR